VAFAGDDQFDIDQGYVGSNQFLFGIMPFFNQNSGASFGSGSGDRAGEWDGDDFGERGGDVNIRLPVTAASLADLDPLCWPFHNPAFYNMTIIGSTPVAAPEFVPVSPAGANRGIFLRNGFAGFIYNSIVVNTGPNPGVEIDSDVGDGCPGFDTTVNANNPGLRGTLPAIAVVSSTLDDGAAPAGDSAQVLANGDAIAPSLGGTANVVNAAGFNGLSNEDVSFDPTGDASGKLVPALKAAPLDPRPAFALTGVIGGVVPQGTGLDPAATYRGAFPRTAPTLWTTGWTVLNIAGLLAD
jgi:hypothetical protein